MAGNLIHMTVPIPRSRQEAHDVLHEHMANMQVIVTHLQKCPGACNGEIASAALTATSALLSLHIYLSAVLECLSARLPPRDRMGGGFTHARSEIMTGYMVLTFRCVCCGQPSSACPDCVNTIAIDPETKLPPDVEIRGDQVVTIPASADALARSVQRPFCDDCVQAVIRATGGKDGLMTTALRHERFHS